MSHDDRERDELESRMNRRHLLTGALAVTTSLAGCGYSYTSEYPLSWDEEVLLHDGRMIVVRVTRYFTRTIDFPFFTTQYILRDMEIEFDAGPPWGRYRRRFVGYSWVAMIERKGGHWYLAIYGDPGKHRLTSPSCPIWILPSEGAERAAASWDEVPAFPLHNLLPYAGPRAEFFRFGGTTLTWEAKLKYWRDHPRAPGDGPERAQLNSFKEAKRLQRRTVHSWLPAHTVMSDSVNTQEPIQTTTPPSRRLD